MGQLATNDSQRILVAVGNAALRESITRTLTERNIVVIEARDGDEVVELLCLLDELSVLPPSAVILDGELSMFSSSVLLDMVDRVLGDVPIVFVNATNSQHLARYPETTRPISVLRLDPHGHAGERTLREIDALRARANAPAEANLFDPITEARPIDRSMLH